jgi:hypothetical protein
MRVWLTRVFGFAAISLSWKQQHSRLLPTEPDEALSDSQDSGARNNQISW